MSTQAKEITAETNKKKQANNIKESQNLTTECGTTISTLVFLETKGNNEPIPENLNIDRIPQDTIPKDTASTSTGTDSNNSESSSNKEDLKPKRTFVGKTKAWAGNVWNSIKKMNIKKIFPKAEYQEYRNANGDLVKIPKKKIPLKKKKQLNDNVLNKIRKEKNKLVVSTYDGVASGLYFNQ